MDAQNPSQMDSSIQDSFAVGRALCAECNTGYMAWGPLKIWDSFPRSVRGRGTPHLFLISFFWSTPLAWFVYYSYRKELLSKGKVLAKPHFVALLATFEPYNGEDEAIPTECLMGFERWIHHSHLENM